ncbi:transcriptional regulator with XRE-family HTH domain [Marinilabilia salmonicolor]|jgi:transcriptional regulator with XRE-family HTH domain|uniref:helix-turn-helix domain-containing protein n=1 Tax=Marinilabilia salmonicolor TaxID=989 RepID=UPI000D0843AC|nr:helix-turn-helix transcriptional regulator [Marinilabilia salmonicolor]PRY90328.1 transcriptional regulator with XRE-family HTH domain [Marinilabilia salmonicolor]
MDNNDQFTVLENKKIGRNLALYRKMRDKKALEVAEHLGLSEAAYTKYERGESKITVELVQKVAEFLKVDPISVLMSQPESFIESFNNSPFTDSPGASAGVGNSSTIGDNYNATNDKQAEMMVKLMENMLKLSERMLEMMEKG